MEAPGGLHHLPFFFHFIVLKSAIGINRKEKHFPSRIPEYDETIVFGAQRLELTLRRSSFRLEYINAESIAQIDSHTQKKKTQPIHSR